MTDEQPALDDGDLRLRPWTAADVETTRLLHDDEIAHWFDVRRSADPSSDAPRGVGRADPHRVGRLARQGRPSSSSGAASRPGPSTCAGAPTASGVLSWVTYAPYRGRGLASRAVRLLVEWAFDELGLRRVEAQVNPSTGPRCAPRCGRACGARGCCAATRRSAGRCTTPWCSAACADDPAPARREGFTAMLDSVLPTKRVIGQGSSATRHGQRAPVRARLQARLGPARRRRRPGRAAPRLRRPRDPGGAGPRRHRRPAARDELAAGPGSGGATPCSSSSTSEPSPERHRAGAPAGARDPRRALGRRRRLAGRVAPYNERLLDGLASAGDGHATLEAAPTLTPRPRYGSADASGKRADALVGARLAVLRSGEAGEREVPDGVERHTDEEDREVGDREVEEAHRLSTSSATPGPCPRQKPVRLGEEEPAGDDGGDGVDPAHRAGPERAPATSGPSPTSRRRSAWPRRRSARRPAASARGPWRSRPCSAATAASSAAASRRRSR